MSKWNSITNNLTDGIETAIVGFQNNEDGKTIAIVIHATKEVEYMDDDARLDMYAQKNDK